MDCVQDVGGRKLPVRNQTYKVYFNNGYVAYVNMQDAFKLLEDSRVKSIELVEE